MTRGQLPRRPEVTRYTSQAPQFIETRTWASNVTSEILHRCQYCGSEAIGKCKQCGAPK